MPTYRSRAKGECEIFAVGSAEEYRKSFQRALLGVVFGFRCMLGEGGGRIEVKLGNWSSECVRSTLRETKQNKRKGREREREKRVQKCLHLLVPLAINYYY